MPKTKLPPTQVPDQHAVIRVADQVRLGHLAEQVRFAYADLLVQLDLHAKSLPLPIVAAVDAVIAAHRHVEDQAALMTVRQPNWHLDGYQVVTVTIPAVCPRCGGPRGKSTPWLDRVAGGVRVFVDRWENPCGHIDRAGDVLREAARYRELVDIDALAAAPSDRAVLQPEQTGSTLPYPWFIAGDGTVGRQDVRKGTPVQLVGFVDQADTAGEIDLEFEDFWAAPDEAIGMFPVFAHDDGTFNTYGHRRIGTVRTEPAEPSTYEDPAVRVAIRSTQGGGR